MSTDVHVKYCEDVGTSRHLGSEHTDVKTGDHGLEISLVSDCCMPVSKRDANSLASLNPDDTSSDPSSSERDKRGDGCPGSGRPVSECSHSGGSDASCSFSVEPLLQEHADRFTFHPIR